MSDFCFHLFWFVNRIELETCILWSTDGTTKARSIHFNYHLSSKKFKSQRKFQIILFLQK